MYMLKFQVNKYHLYKYTNHTKVYFNTFFCFVWCENSNHQNFNSIQSKMSIKCIKLSSIKNELHLLDKFVKLCNLSLHMSAHLRNETMGMDHWKKCTEIFFYLMYTKTLHFKFQTELSFIKEGGLKNVNKVYLKNSKM